MFPCWGVGDSRAPAEREVAGGEAYRKVPG